MMQHPRDMRVWIFLQYITTPISWRCRIIILDNVWEVSCSYAKLPLRKHNISGTITYTRSNSISLWKKSSHVTIISGISTKAILASLIPYLPSNKSNSNFLALLLTQLAYLGMFFFVLLAVQISGRINSIVKKTNLGHNGFGEMEIRWRWSHKNWYCRDIQNICDAGCFFFYVGITIWQSVPGWTGTQYLIYQFFPDFVWGVA